MRRPRQRRFITPFVPALFQVSNTHCRRAAARAMLWCGLVLCFDPRAVLAQRASGPEPRATRQLGAPTLTVREPFSEVVALAEFPDGRLLVADRRDKTFYVVGATGTPVSVLGRNGAGPNEYTGAFGLVRLPGDTLALFGGNQRYLRVTPAATFAEALPIPVTLLRGGGLAPAGGVDARGGYYWLGDAVGTRNGTFKRNQSHNVRRWQPPSEGIDTVAPVVDHAAEMHDRAFHPFAERDAWVVAPDGRVGVLSAKDYRLKWYLAGKLVAEGPVLPFTPIPITRADREAFRAERMRQPMGGMRSNNPSGRSEPSPEERKRIEEAFADAVFPTHKPPFVENGLLRAPNGDLWVIRSAPFAAEVQRVDILSGAGARTASLDLPRGRRLVALDRRGVYLVRVDDEGLEWLERYAWP